VQLFKRGFFHRGEGKILHTFFVREARPAVEGFDLIIAQNAQSFLGSVNFPNGHVLSATRRSANQQRHFCLTSRIEGLMLTRRR
jgi:hypothetical protein